MILDVLGWPLALALLVAVAATLYRLVKRNNYRNRGVWILPVLTLALAAAAFTLLGVLPAIAGWALTGVLVAVLVALPWKKGHGARYALQRAGNDGIHLREDVRAGGGWLFRWLRRMLARLRGGKEIPATEVAVAEAVSTRNIPSVRDDPALGPAPEPASLATSAPIPGPYAALASYIGGFVPEDDQALKMFMQSNAAGEVAVADAWHTFADTCLGSIGLDPAYVAGILEAGDSAGEHATLLAQVHKRLGVIYGQVQEWISAGHQLPHKAREWLTGEAA